MWVIEGSNPDDELRVCRRLLESRMVEITTRSRHVRPDGSTTIYVDSEELSDALQGLFPELMGDY